MKAFTAVFGVAVLASGLAFAQSSGNFSATGSGASCMINSTTGALSGGIGVTSFTTYISTSGGQGVTLDIRPDLVTGLFTDTKISTTVPSATADVGIQVCVSVDGSPINGSPSPVKPAPCVTYDQRFQQISSQLFSQLLACTASNTGSCNTGTACNLAAVPALTCAAGQTCSSAVGPGTCSDPTLCSAGSTCTVATGTCLGPNPLCNFELILSTLSAHSFDFVVPVDNKKPHTIVTSWSTVGAPNSNAISCVGPGITTVTQTKVFNNSGALTF
jgi:hypothetical protein